MSLKSEDKLFDVWIRIKPYSPHPGSLNGQDVSPKRYSSVRYLDKSPHSATTGPVHSSTKKRSISSFYFNNARGCHQLRGGGSSTLKSYKMSSKSPKIKLSTCDPHSSKKDSKAIQLNSEGDLVITRVKQGHNRTPNKQKTVENRVIKFPSIFDENQKNQDIYAQVVESKVKKCFQGLSFTLLTYGISGSGKTHTTLGSLNREHLWEDGMLFHTVESLFNHKERAISQAGSQVSIKASFIEIYNESVYDLLSEDISRKLAVVESPLTNGVLVPDLVVREVERLDELKGLIMFAQERRVVSPNLNNKFSSR